MTYEDRIRALGRMREAASEAKFRAARAESEAKRAGEEATALAAHIEALIRDELERHDAELAARTK